MGGILTTGISCGTCALVSEINFRRLAGVEKVTISRSNEAVLISYKPGFAFNPQQLREILKRLDVGVVQFQISARGRVRQEGGKQFFVAGADKFLLTPDAKSPQLSTATPVLIEGIINDRVNPMELRVMTSKPVPIK
jgi:hypothetical protein